MQNLIKELSKLKIAITLNENQLDIKAPKGTVTPELLQQIKLHKEELISFLSMYKEEVYALPIKISKAVPQEDYVLSSSQKRMWLLDQLEGGNTAYNMPNVFKIKGDIKIDVLKEALNALIKRHEILRTNFIVDKSTSEPRQVIHCPADNKFQLGYFDLSAKKDDIAGLLDKELAYTFDLTSSLLLRAILVKVATDHYVFSFVIHHIISDGWSSNVILKDLFSLYKTILNAEESLLPALEIQYKDFATWQKAQLSSETMGIQKNYWMSMFKEGVPVLDIPVNKQRPSVKTYAGSSVKKDYKKELHLSFKELCKAQDTTFFMGILAGVNILIYKYTNQKDIVIGTPVAGRQYPELQNQIGLYINTLALKTTIDPEKTFSDFLLDIKKSVVKAYEHQEYPFDELVKNLKLPIDRSRNPLFDVLLTVEKKKVEVEAFAGIKIEELTIKDHTSKCDLEFAFIENDDGFNLLLTYNPHIYQEDFILQLTNHMEVLLQNIITSPKCSIRSLSCLSSLEKEKVLVSFNGTAEDYPMDETIDSLIDDQVHRTPNNIAVAYNDKSLTYQELHERSNQLGHYLRERYEIKPGDFIGIKLKRNEELMIVVLGILKSGAAYVPIDVGYPQDRIDYIQKDANCKLIIDADELNHFHEIRNGYPKAKISSNKTSRDLAYIIYTSGTTGKPKGVMINHQSAVAFISWAQNEFDKKAFDVTYAATSHCFDLSVFEMFYTLSVGKKVKILKSALEIGKHLKHDTNVMLNTVPSSIRNVLDGGYSLANVSFVNLAGETFPSDLAPRLLSCGAEVRNLYGPSEDTTYSTCYKLSSEKKYDSIPIGRPIANSQVYILGDDLQVMPIGIPGKLFVSGAGVALGYLNKVSLTSRKFIANPFLPGERMYDTGDIGKWLPDGTIEYLGRGDQQIKLRGYRIELGEIEYAILSYSKNIRQAVVKLVTISSREILVSYCVEKKAVDKSKLKLYLKEKLPAYMIPSHFVVLKSIPLTPNGKIDDKALPKIVSKDLVKNEYVSPRNEVEKQLAEIWQEVLGVDLVGVEDNFFELGGNSLVFMRIYEKFKSNSDSKISLPQFYTSHTIALQARLLSENLEVKYDYTKGAGLRLPGNLNYFWPKAKVSLNAKNVSFGITTTTNIDFDALNIAFRMVCDKHTILKSNICEKEGGFFFKQSDTPNNLELVQDFSNDAILNKCKKIHEKKFDYYEEPLVRGYVFKNGKINTVLFFSVPHLIFDGISTVIFWKDLFEAYSSSKRLKPLENQFIDSAFMRENLSSTMNPDSLYWKKLFQKKIKPIELHQIENIITSNNQSIEVSFNFDFKFEEQLNGLVKELRISFNTFFLSVIALVVYLKSNRKSFALCFDHHSRTEDSMDQIGFWVQNIFTEIEISNVSLNIFFEIVNKKINESIKHSNVDILTVATDTYKNSFEDRLNELKRIRFNYYDESENGFELDNLSYEHFSFNNTFFIPAYLHFFVVKMDEGVRVSIMANSKYFERKNLIELKDLFNMVCMKIVSEGKDREVEFISRLLK